MIDYLFAVEQLISYLLIFRYIAVFIVVYLGGLGVPMPVNTILFTAAVFADQGHFNIFILFITALGANILGDLCIYSLARFLGRKFIEKNYHKKLHFIIRRVEHRIKPLQERFERHEVVAIVASRFISPLNTIANVCAGLVRVPVPTFIMAAAIGDCMSISTVLTFGFFIEESWGIVASILGAGGALLSTIIVVVVVVMIVRVARARKKPPQTL